MRLPKTVKGYILTCVAIESISLYSLKDFDKLPKELQQMLGALSANIANDINEILDVYKDYKNIRQKSNIRRDK